MGLPEDILRVLREAGDAGLDGCGVKDKLGLQQKPQAALMKLREKGLIQWISGTGPVKGRWVAASPKSLETSSGGSAGPSP